MVYSKAQDNNLADILTEKRAEFANLNHVASYPNILSKFLNKNIKKEIILNRHGIIINAQQYTHLCLAFY